MNISFDKTITQQYHLASQKEWLETNGLGGWASSTITGVHTRRYHGLLVAATHPPVGRMVLLSKLDETLYVNGQTYELGANQYPGAIHPQGYQYLTRFNKDLFPEFTYEAGGITLKKTIAAIHGENSTVITYEVLSAEAEFTLELQPFVSGRDYHSLSHANDSINQQASIEADLFQYQPYAQQPDIYISVPGAVYSSQPNWYYNLEYAIEQYRGLDFGEDLFTPGKFQVRLKSGNRLGIIVSTDHPAGKDAFSLLETEHRRRTHLFLNLPHHTGFTEQLALAADQFVVQRGENLKTIIAGYHWFSDWGRDTMIALPGICLATGRFEDAKKILLSFANAVSQGMLPNRFPDYGETPEYNTADATLWFFVAIYKYWKITGDIEFIYSTLFPVLKDILEWHQKGTRYHIHTESGLLYTGEPGVQLTWMDAKVGDWVVTPRQGFAVEINALWYNALSIYSLFAKETGQNTEAETYKQLAEQTKKAFTTTFWNPEKQYLYDVIDHHTKDDSLRPNQLFAISLPFQLMTGEKAKSILQVIEEKLYTPVGLRSLSAAQPDYKPHYGGDSWHRDGAYHQGTVWSWLLGPYVDAILIVKGKAGVKQVRQVINNLAYHLQEAGIGTISEIFDAEYPHTPRGCMAQAWSVGEILRVLSEYDLSEPKKTAKKKAELV
jgi:predicted glycogen debranching enzyme